METDRQDGDGLPRCNRCPPSTVHDDGRCLDCPRRATPPTRDGAEGAGKQEEWAFCLPWSYDPGQGGSADEPEMTPHVGDADGLVLFSFVGREVRDDTEGELWWVNWHVQFPRLVEAVNTLGSRPALDWSKACPQCGAHPTEDCKTPRDCFDDVPAPPKPAPDAMREALKPFSRLFERFEEGRKARGDSWPGDHVEFNARPRTDKESTGYNFGDLRRAHEAFSSAPVPPADGAAKALADRAEGCLNSRNSAYPSDVLRECVAFLRALSTSPAVAAESEPNWDKIAEEYMPSTATPSVRGDREAWAHLREAVEDLRYSNETIGVYVRNAWAALSLPVQPGADEREKALRDEIFCLREVVRGVRILDHAGRFKEYDGEPWLQRVRNIGLDHDPVALSRQAPHSSSKKGTDQ